MIVAVIPAHNEEVGLPGTIASLLGQTLPPDRIIVASDNSTDGTVAAALIAGAEVFETVGNTDKKAGALNQALARLLPELGDQDCILAVDGDTELDPGFVFVAHKVLCLRPNVAAVGGVFEGREPKGLLQWMQANEYERYRREIARSGRTMVLSGTAALIRVVAAREVAEGRGTRLPGLRGDVYHRSALTEDMEFGLALKSLGWQLRSPITCGCTTELMPSWRALHDQRVRWYRGALENLIEYGVNRVTARYWAQQAMLALVTIMFTLYLLLTILVIAHGEMAFSPFWTAVGGVFVAERVITVWRSGCKNRLLAAAMLPEMAYDFFLQGAFLAAAWKTLTRSQSVWLHANEESSTCTTTAP